ncbi:MAG: hypothetical protein KDA24_27560 [Deltaproteobacteria bacterium]|nr:hypothetical protein [Deltaproteobacteria bacterium]
MKAWVSMLLALALIPQVVYGKDRVLLGAVAVSVDDRRTSESQPTLGAVWSSPSELGGLRGEDVAVRQAMADAAADLMVYAGPEPFRDSPWGLRVAIDTLSCGETRSSCTWDVTLRLSLAGESRATMALTSTEPGSSESFEAALRTAVVGILQPFVPEIAARQLTGDDYIVAGEALLRLPWWVPERHVSLGRGLVTLTDGTPPGKMAPGATRDPALGSESAAVAQSAARETASMEAALPSDAHGESSTPVAPPPRVEAVAQVQLPPEPQRYYLVSDDGRRISADPARWEREVFFVSLARPGEVGEPMDAWDIYRKTGLEEPDWYRSERLSQELLVTDGKGIGTGLVIGGGATLAVGAFVLVTGLLSPFVALFSWDSGPLDTFLVATPIGGATLGVGGALFGTGAATLVKSKRARKRRQARRAPLSETHEWDDAVRLIRRANDARAKDTRRPAEDVEEGGGEGTEREQGTD